MSDEQSSALTSLVTSGVFIAFGFIFNYGVSFLFQVLTARYLGTTGFGAFALGTAITSISTIALLGLDRGVGRYLPRKDDKGYKRKVLFSAVTIIIPSSVILCLLVFISAKVIAINLFSQTASTPLVRVFALSIPFLVWVRFCVGATQGMELTRPKIVLQNFLIPISKSSLAVIAVLLGAGTFGIATAYTLTFVLAGVVGTYYLVNYTPLTSGTLSQTRSTEMILFSLPIMVIAVSNVIMTSIDSMMLAYFGGTSWTGIYNSALPLARFTLIGLLSFNFLAMPILSRLHSNGELAQMKQIYSTLTKWILAATFPIIYILLVFPEFLMRLVFGPDYVTGAGALAILAIGFSTHVIAGPNEDTIVSLGDTKDIMVDSVGIVVFNVILNYVLIPKYAYIGAALATALSFTALNIAFSARLYNSTGIHSYSMSMIVLLFTAISLIIPSRILTSSFSESLILKLGVTTFAGIAFYSIAILFGTGKEEKTVLSILEERTDRDLSWIKQLISAS